MLGAEAGPACTARGTIHPPRAPSLRLRVRPRHPWVPPRGLGRRPRHPASEPRPAPGTVRGLPSQPRPAPGAAPLSPAPVPSALPRSPQLSPARLSPARAPSSPGSLSALPREWFPSDLPSPLSAAQSLSETLRARQQAALCPPVRSSVFATPP